MAWDFLSWFRRSPKEAHDALFTLNQGLIGEQRLSANLKDLAEVAEEKLETFAHLVEETKKYEGGDQDVAEAARAIREGFAALIATPPHLFPTDSEARREAMQIPSDGSTNSQPKPINGLSGGSSQKALPNGTPAPMPPDGQGPALPRRPRGRPKGSVSKTRKSQPPTKDQDDRES